MSLRVVVAPDSFKGSLAADRVATEIAVGWHSVRPHDILDLLPQADGGEGTLDAVLRSVPGARRRSAGMVTGPDGRPVPGEWVALPDGTAVIELAQSSGLPLMHTPDPLGASTRGLGEVIAAALATGAHTLWVGLGGSASTDGGAGALSALGVRLVDGAGASLAPGGAALRTLVTLDRSTLLAPPPGGVLLLTDVTTPLLGSHGAAAVFAPQKGAGSEEVALLERALGHYATVLGGDPAAAGAGAAGGTAYGLATVWGAQIRSGWEHLADLSGIRTRIAEADVLITGEGRFDEQSLGGKGVGRLLEAAQDHTAIPLVIAGQVTADPGCWSVALGDLAGSPPQALADPARYLRQAGAIAARELPR